MAERKRPAKSETLTIRLDPKTRFMLEFMARLRGQTITTVVERAITEAANNATIESHNNIRTWRSFWNANDGIRACRLAREEALLPTYEEEYILNFTKIHHPFFYTNGNMDQPIQHYFDVLWPRIDEFVGIHEKSMTEDFFAAGKAMQAALKAAKLAAPAWPIPKNHKEVDGEEIPF